MDGTVDLGVSLGRRLEKRDLGTACTLARRVHSRVRASRPPPPDGALSFFYSRAAWGEPGAGAPASGSKVAARRRGHLMRGRPVQLDIRGGWGGRRPCRSPRARTGLGDGVGGWPGRRPNAGFPGSYLRMIPIGTIKRPHVFTIWKALGPLTWFQSYVSGGGLDI